MYTDMEIQDYIANQQHFYYEDNMVKKENLPTEIYVILTKWGVPNKVEPFIHFLPLEEKGFCKLSDYYDINDYKENDYIDIDELEDIWNDFEQYITIANVAGDIIVLNEEYQVIEIHYNSLDETYINYSLHDFLECILCYHYMVEDIKGRFSEEVYYDEHITTNDIDKLKSNLLTIDEFCLDDDTFWYARIVSLEKQIL